MLLIVSYFYVSCLTINFWIGPPGEPGSQGSQGPEGKTGSRGDPGQQGFQGPQGLKGDKGDAGEKGDAGPLGPMGVKRGCWTIRSNGRERERFVECSVTNIANEIAGCTKVSYASMGIIDIKFSTSNPQQKPQMIFVWIAALPDTTVELTCTAIPNKASGGSAKTVSIIH
jgi:hypothetical protein